jgi:hypothetical protein
MQGKGLKTVNLEQGMPSSDQAIKRLTYEIASSKSLGFDVLKVIHGYGSSGTGGKIRVETRKYLDRQMKSGRIKAFVAGEDFSIFDENARKLLNACGELRKDSDLERHNNGVTFVLL